MHVYPPSYAFADDEVDSDKENCADVVLEKDLIFVEADGPEETWDNIVVAVHHELRRQGHKGKTCVVEGNPVPT